MSVCVMFISIDPNIILPIGCGLGGVTVLFIISVTIFYVFKVDIVLWVRRAFSVLYTDKGKKKVLTRCQLGLAPAFCDSLSISSTDKRWMAVISNVLYAI